MQRAKNPQSGRIMEIKLKTDSHGNVVAFALTGFEIRTAEALGVLMAIEYIDKLNQIGTGERNTFQTIMTAEEALALADTLTTAAHFFSASDSGAPLQ